MNESAARHIDVETRQGVLILKVVPDELRDMAMCYEVRDQMIQAIDPTKTQQAIIDLQNVNFIGSIGLLGFLGVRRAIPKSRIVVCNASESLQEMLTLCRLISLDNEGDPPFEYQPRIEDALGSLGSESN